MAGPLDGIRVLDFSRALAGPHCGRLLTDLGADVIKIEPPEGDQTRFGTPRVNSMVPYFVQQNCGKRNVSLDLRHPEAVDLLRRLAAHADVVLENFRAGVMDRMGLGYQTLSEIQPRLIFASISGYGQDGPLKDRRAYAPVVAAEMGFLHLTAHYRKAEVEQEVYSHADLYAGLHCLTGILAALHERERTGRGQRLEVSLAESLLFMNEYTSTVFSGFPVESRGLPATIGSPVFATKEGHKITVGGDPLLKDNFRAWCTAMGRDDLYDDPRFRDFRGREAHRGEIMAAIASWVGEFEDLDDLGRRLEDVGFSYGVVRTLEEVAASDWAKERDVLVEVSDRGDGVFRIPRSPWRFSQSAAGVRGVAAYRGEHNREVFGGLLGLSEDELAALERRGVLSYRPARQD